MVGLGRPTRLANVLCIQIAKSVFSALGFSGPFDPEPSRSELRKRLYFLSRLAVNICPVDHFELLTRTPAGVIVDGQL